MSTLLRGAPVAERLTLDLSRRSAALRHRGVIPTLAILRVGSSPGDLADEKSAAARCARCGVEVRRLFWDSAAPLADAIRAVNADPSIHGCLLLRPLADRAAEAAAGQLLLPGKAVDGMATEQGYYALAAYYRFANAQTRLYDMTDVTIQTGGSNTPATGDTGVLVWIIALPVAALAAAFVLKRKEREA